MTWNYYKRMTFSDLATNLYIPAKYLW